jgi:deoxyribose-phosphate aldolase
LSKIGHFQALISVTNLNRSTTCYSVLEMVENDQQYFNQSVVIHSTCQKLFAENQPEEPGIKIGRFRSTILNT